MSEMLELALCVEAMTGPDRKVLEYAWLTCFPKPDRIWITDNTGSWTPEYADWQFRHHRFWNLLDAEAWIDAAMTLVPEGWHLHSLGKSKFMRVPWLAMLVEADDGAPYSGPQGNALSPALALCAASLRARAALEGGNA